MTYKLTNLHHFPGFYNSHLKYYIESYVEMESEWAFDQSNDNCLIESDKLNMSIYSGLLWDNYKHNIYKELIADYYIDSFIEYIADYGLKINQRKKNYASEIDLHIKLKFEAIDSPKYYNFETDKLICKILIDDIRKILKAHKKDNYKHLNDFCIDNFTSISGFHSFYSNDYNDIINKNINDLDCNEIGALISSLYNYEKFKEAELYFCEDICGNGELENCFDWPKIESELEALKG